MKLRLSPSIDQTDSIPFEDTIIVSFIFNCIGLGPKPKPTPVWFTSSITHAGAETAVLCAVVRVCHATAALHVAATLPHSSQLVALHPEPSLSS